MTIRTALGIVAATLTVCASCVGAPSDELLANRDFGAFKPTKDWRYVGTVEAVPGQTQLKFGGTGGILVNGAKKCGAPYLMTKKDYGDVRVEVEFMVPKNSNSGVYLMGRYEIQILDSFGKDTINYGDLGGVYQRWDAKRSHQGYDGVAAKVNAAKAPGEWQTFDITFRAPRFDADGKKLENARFVKVLVNGKVAHENQEATGPTRSAQFSDEKPTGPLTIQGNHGPIAIRKLTVTPLELD